MAFGQPSGPPATARQLRDLTALVEAAGHTGFRDARGPLGLTQRQAGGRFTRDEAEALIAHLEADAEAGAGERGAGGDGDDGQVPPAPGAPVAPRRTAPGAQGAPGARAATLADQLRRVPEELLVDELRRRGWALIPPSLAN
ncbi:MAG TPA: hypothetical protein VND44_09430 [Acidimicrobiales bacterium]|nr:hypothetical protein [Acidimicrobiales bacterium]